MARAKNDEPAPEQPGTGQAEFFSDQQRDTHVRALRAEKRGYEARIEGAKRKKDSDTAAFFKIRADEVQEELNRILGDDAETEEGDVEGDPQQPAAAASA